MSPHISHPRRKFDQRPGRTASRGPNSVGKVPITRMLPVAIEEDFPRERPDSSGPLTIEQRLRPAGTGE